MRTRKGQLSVVAGLIACWLALGVGAAQAKPGQLDKGFGEQGQITIWAGGLGDRWQGNPAGQLQLTTAGGGTLVAALGRTLLKRTASGMPDRGFGRNGWVQVPLAPEVKFAPRGIAIDAKGRILLAGTSWTDNHETNSWVTVLRFLADGAPDPTFGSGGAVSTNFGLPIPIEPPAHPVAGPGYKFTQPVVGATGLAVDAQGRPVITGSWVEKQQVCYPERFFDVSRGFVARLQVDGAPDPSFNGSGVAVMDTEEVSSPRIGSRGEITVRGEWINCRRGAPTDQGLRRLGPAGLPDAAFGAGGSVAPLFFGAPEMAIDRFGRILLAGRGSLEDDATQIRRLSPNGHLDRRFDGTVSLPENAWDLALGVDRKGRALLATSVRGPESSEVFLLRRNREGGVDKGFGRRGRMRTSVPASSTPETILVDGRGRIVVGALTESSPAEGEGYGLTLVRYRGGRP